MSASVAANTVTSPRPPLRVVLADDAYLVRVALKHSFDGVPAITIVGACEDARTVERVVDEQRADLLITDLPRVPPMTGPIVCGVDISESARTVLDTARWLANGVGARLLVVHVIEEPVLEAEEFASTVRNRLSAGNHDTSG